MDARRPPIITPLLLLVLAASTHSAVVVKRGRDVFLTSSDLDVDTSSELCRYHVVMDDPLTQRVGRVTPTNFDCNFPSDTVRYEHNGNPLHNNDTVRMRRYTFRGASVSMETIETTITVVDAPHDVIVDDPRLKPLVVREQLTTSNVIDASTLRFRYNYYSGVSCTLSYSKSFSSFPLAGVLVDRHGTELESLERDCRWWLVSGVRYRHVLADSIQIDYIPLQLEVVDLISGQSHTMERLFLPVTIQGSQTNTPPHIDIHATQPLTVQQYSVLRFSTEIMSASDLQTPASKLIVNSSLSQDAGFFINTMRPTKAVSSFTMEELEDAYIAYHPPVAALSDVMTVHVQFTAFDSQMTRSNVASITIQVNPYQGTAPKVALNRGLVAFEGLATPLTPDDLVIYDRDNPRDVRVYVRSGPRHGRLTMNGAAVSHFALDDLRSGRVVYTHNGGDTTDDKLVLRITDDIHSLRIRFPITIIPNDDSAPYLMLNRRLQVKEGGFVCVTNDNLVAHDKDSPDDSIIYIMKTLPRVGEIVWKSQPLVTGQTVTTFTQRDIDRGLIYYRHLGGEAITDSFEIRVSDTNPEPNKSSRNTVEVVVLESDDLPPMAVQDVARHVDVAETDVVVLSRDQLWYEDLERPNEVVQYTVTSLPYYVSTMVTLDAGKIINTSNMTSLYKDTTQQAISTFTQTDVDQGRIAYMPPIEDIGPIHRQAQFVFAVSDQNGNHLMDQVFDITILPVNNQQPHMTVHPLSTQEGGTARISRQYIAVYDPDTRLADLVYTVEEEPRYGQLVRDDSRLVKGEQFTYDDVLYTNIRYEHDGSETMADTFALSISDGEYKVTRIIPVNIQLVLDQSMEQAQLGSPDISVEEGGSQTLTAAQLGTGGTSQHMTRVYMVIKPPVYGEIQNEGVRVNDFSVRDVWSGRISYVHTGGETGLVNMTDTIILMVADQSLPPPAGTKPLVDLNVTITPVDNSPPAVLLGAPMMAYEGQRSPITNEVLRATDVDTRAEDLFFVITRGPMWGQIMHRTATPGPVVNTFTLEDIRNEVILYIRRKHNDSQPVLDRFTVYASDGTHNTSEIDIEVTIIPDNNMIPGFTLGDMHVAEGSWVSFYVGLNNSRNMAEDTIMELMVSVLHQPQHGSLVLRMDAIGGRDEVLEIPLREVSIADLSAGIEPVYKHDGSESVHDEFILRLSDGHHARDYTASVTIDPVNDQIPETGTNGILHVTFGDSKLIEQSSLEVTDADTSPDQLVYVIITEPRKGVVEKLIGDRWVRLGSMANFTQDDVNSGRVRYLHTRSFTSFPMDDFVFELTDGVHTMTRDTFVIDIGISEENTVAVMNRGLRVDQDSHAVIIPDALSAFDGIHVAHEFVFVVTTPPRHGVIRTVTENQLVSSFTQADLQALNIMYVHTGARETLDSFDFTVTNGANQTTDGTFNITLVPTDTILPSLNVNVPLTVIQGETAPITTQNLRISDADTQPGDVMFILFGPPQYGSLLKNGSVVVDTFSQQDVNDGLMEYRSNNRDEAGVDFLLFSISDGQNEGFLINGTLENRPAFFNILIQPIGKEPPRIVRNAVPDHLETLPDGRKAFILNQDVLQAEHALSESRHIVYSLKERPTFGVLENLGTGRPVNRKFTQRDVDERLIVFVLEDAAASSNDSFTFRVQDKNRNTLDNQVFLFEWSVVSFTQAEHIVCEDAHTLPIVIQRHGALNSNVTVQIRTKAMSATEDEDYIISSTREVRFLPGETKFVWNVEVVQDSVREGNEKFKVILRNPTNAVLAENDKTVVLVVDYDNGYCAEYIGIVTRQQQPRALPEAATQTGLRPQTDHALTGHRPGPGADSTSVRSESRLLETDPDFYEGHGPEENRGSNSEQLVWNWNYERENEAESSSHPLHKYGRRNKRRRKRRRHNESEPSTTAVPLTTTTTPPRANIPQQCTEETEGLLYIDLLTSKMYRCSGVVWQPWGWGSNYAYSSLLSEQQEQQQQQERQQQRGQQAESPSTQPTDVSHRRCPAGWSRHRDSCYRMMMEKETWSIGEHRCRELGGHLTEVSSNKHMQFLWELSGRKSFWIGLSAHRRSNAWHWTNDAPQRYYNWRQGFPKRRGAFAKKCVMVSRHSEWVNRPCNTVTARYICSQAIRRRRRRNNR